MSDDEYIPLCVACQGTGELSGGPCRHCGGTGVGRFTGGTSPQSA